MGGDGIVESQAVRQSESEGSVYDGWALETEDDGREGEGLSQCSISLRAY